MSERRTQTIPRNIRRRRVETAASKKKKLAILSAFAAIAVMVMGLYASSTIGSTTIRDLGAVAAVIVGIMPIAAVNMKEVIRKNSIDKNLPIFLLALRSSIVSGHSILQGLTEVANRKLGALTPELKNLRANLSWGMPLEEAFENFVQRVGTRTSRRVMVLLNLAIEAGGNVADTIDIIQKHVSEMQNLENERKGNMRPYIITIYISFAVFLAIAAILVFQFFGEIERLQTTLTTNSNSQVPGLFGGLADVNIKHLKELMLHMSIAEAIFGGLIAGKIGEGSYVAGIKHVVILIVISVVVFAMIGAV
ncbi:MAG TPA: type II secretion system F family protein [Nitrosopumilaceae archaeon]|nr:type II secretion system F family protein [Nitrosopumilaceae archaeon]